MNPQIVQGIGGCLLGMNLLTWMLYGIDKQKARRRRWRIPEKTLLFLAAAGGSVGALTGMYMFHHKTKKWKFRLGVPLILLLQLVAAGMVYSYFR